MRVVAPWPGGCQMHGGSALPSRGARIQCMRATACNTLAACAFGSAQRHSPGRQSGPTTCICILVPPDRRGRSPCACLGHTTLGAPIPACMHACMVRVVVRLTAPACGCRCASRWRATSCMPLCPSSCASSTASPTSTSATTAAASRAAAAPPTRPSPSPPSLTPSSRCAQRP